MNQDKLVTIADESLDQVAGGGLITDVLAATGEAAEAIGGALVTGATKVVKAIDTFLKPVIRWIW